MKPYDLMSTIIADIESRRGDEVFMIGIDGVDAAGKTTFASQLSDELRKRNHVVIEASMDGFHNPREKRYRMGRDSPEGYYRDSFNIDALMEHLLDPLGKGKPFKTSVFDYRVGSETDEPTQQVQLGSVLVFEGVFSFRPELVDFWDYRIYLDITPDESLRRGVERDPGEKEEIERKYRVRYLPGQELFKEEARPCENAHIIVDYNDPMNPEII